MVTLDDALAALDTTALNIKRLDDLLGSLRREHGQVDIWGRDSPAAGAYRRLRPEFLAFAAALPEIDGWRITAAPPDIDTPGDLPSGRLTHEIAEYKSRFAAMRRAVIRPRLAELAHRIEDILQRPIVTKAETVDEELLADLRACIAELEKLSGDEIEWGNLRRHLGFGMAVDIRDIRLRDWPPVRERVQSLVHENTPRPILVGDLAHLLGATAKARAAPANRTLNWAALDPAAFERLLLAMLTSSPTYEKAEALTNVAANDGGADILAWRAFDCPLSDRVRQRVVIQCKRWITRSVNHVDVDKALSDMRLWFKDEPIDVLVIATTKGFTRDGIARVNQNNGLAVRPTIEMWNASKLENLLHGRYPDLLSRFGLKAESADHPAGKAAKKSPAKPLRKPRGSARPRRRAIPAGRLVSGGRIYRTGGSHRS